PSWRRGRSVPVAGPRCGWSRWIRPPARRPSRHCCWTGTAWSPAARWTSRTSPAVSPRCTGCSPCSRRTAAAGAAISSTGSAPRSSPRSRRSIACAIGAMTRRPLPARRRAPAGAVRTRPPWPWPSPTPRTPMVTDNAAELYEILADHPDAVTIGGHTHTLEHPLAGHPREEWAAAGIDELSHDQIVAGAVSGSWYSGELNEDGVPHAYTSDGAEPGVLTMEFDGTERSEYYTVRGEEQDKQFLTGLNSPTWREWAAEAQQWQDDDKDGEGPGPMEVDSVSLEDVRSGESWVSSSFFGGSTGAEVLFSLDGAEATAGTLTQPMTGEALNKGWEFTEPVSATHNLSSTGAVAQASPHLWRADLPTDLEPGEHTVEVTATDRYGATYTDSFTFTVEDGNGADDADDADDGEAAGETDSE